MKGVQYLYDAKGEAQVVLIDLKKNRALWEDFHDIMIARERRSEARVPLDRVEADLRKRGKLK